LQGAHPELIEGTRYDNNLAKKIHKASIKVEAHTIRVDSHPKFNPACNPNTNGNDLPSKNCLNTSRSFGKQKEVDHAENFIQGEELGTETVPKCGGCCCNKCPTVGHTYSFREEQELKMIQDNLGYDNINRCWVISYPWLIDPRTLSDNY
jgi:hypothetical protein